MDKQKTGIFSRIYKVVSSAETAIACIAFALMCLAVLTTIVYRFILQEPMLWAEELSRYLMIVGIFVAMPVAIRDHVHLGVDMFIAKLPGRMHMIAKFISDCITLAAYIAICIACYMFLERTLAGSQMSPAMHIPMAIMYGIIFFGFVTGTISQIMNMIDDYFTKKTEAEK